MPLKYDKIFSCIHHLLCLCQPLRLDVFLRARRFSFVKRNAKFVPKLFNFEQKQRRIEVAQESLTMPQSPYSPEMAPCDFFLFPKIKRTLKGRRFTDIDDIKSASLKELKALPKIEFKKCFEDWKKRWHKCIISNGDYFEGDNINVDE